MVESASPPITVIPIGARNELSPVSDKAVGTMPAIIAIEVMMIGCARLCPASAMAVILSTPCSISSIAKSMSRIEFFATMPSSMSRPIKTGIEIG